MSVGLNTVVCVSNLTFIKKNVVHQKIRYKTNAHKNEFVINSSFLG